MLSQDSFIANLLRLIDKMRPSKSAVKEKPSSNRAPASGKENVGNDVSLRRAICPALALPNNPDVRVRFHYQWFSYFFVGVTVSDIMVPR